MGESVRGRREEGIDIVKEGREREKGREVKEREKA